MIHIIEADVFWSDIVLGAIALYCVKIVATKDKRWTGIFTALAIATWVGAFYHGLINTTSRISGDILWTLTLFFFALTSALVVRAVVGKKWQVPLFTLLALYTFYAIFVSEAFIWALLLQAISLITYGVYTIHNRILKQSVSATKALMLFVLFFVIDIAAVYIQQTKTTFGLDISHNTIFHIFEMPALILLAISMKYVSKKK